ncbi:unnamed protein product [Prorocentrum cordatum]|uniref:Uncharacterized protein n=1 Tax=Prorocentrum cordatum TaxID=2364126 RepID=A0ABN9QGY5_9DINO|nr:unnamed protein product [Polarella glacialis]
MSFLPAVVGPTTRENNSTRKVISKMVVPSTFTKSGTSAIATIVSASMKRVTSAGAISTTEVVVSTNISGCMSVSASTNVSGSLAGVVSTNVSGPSTKVSSPITDVSGSTNGSSRNASTAVSSCTNVRVGVAQPPRDEVHQHLNEDLHPRIKDERLRHGNRPQHHEEEEREQRRQK